MRRALVVLVWALLSGAGAQSAGTLRIVMPGIQQSDGGAPVPPGFTHIAGEILFFSFQVDGYRVSPQLKVRLGYKIEALDPKGVPIVEPVESVLDTEISEEDKEWKPKVRHQIPVPPLALPGDYQIKVQIKDELAGSAATAQIPFVLRGRQVEPSAALVIRNFRFFRSEEDPEPLPAPVYRAGDAVWARFDITGYKLAKGNQLEVSYGVAVANSAGKVLWSQPEAALEKTQSFYPQPYVPGSMALNLQSNIHPGQYMIVITARDLIGNQNVEEKHSFSVE
jgi:hypothetical protein